MNPSSSQMVEETVEKSQKSEQDQKQNIPLRQRRLPASFWQEPAMVPSPSNREISHSATVPSLIHQYPITSLQPWTMNSTPPMVMPQRLIPPNHFLLSRNSNPQWIQGSSNCCTCATCLNYSYVIPRLPEAYSGLRYRPPMNVPCCPGINCVDQSCKLCFTQPDHWHPDRLRHFRLRTARVPRRRQRPTSPDTKL